MDTTVVFDDGRWFLELRPTDCAEPFELEITEAEAIALQDFGIGLYVK
jgi:hypothetical protein